MPEFRAGSPEQVAYLESLVDAGLLTRTGVHGVYARGGTFERGRLQFDALVTRAGDTGGIRDIHADGCDPPSVTLERRAVLGPPHGAEHTEAPAGQVPRDGGADAGRGPGDDYGPVHGGIYER